MVEDQNVSKRLKSPQINPNLPEPTAKLKRLIVITHRSVFAPPHMHHMIAESIFDAVLTMVLQIRGNSVSSIDRSGSIWLSDKETGIVATIYGNGNWNIEFPSIMSSATKKEN